MQSQIGVRQNSRSPLLRKIWMYRTLYLMIAVGVLYFVIFKYATIYGLLIAFKNYKFKLGILGSEWVGLANFQKALTNKDFLRVCMNTLVISAGRIASGFPAPIVLALLLNELRFKTFKRVTQSILYLPYFISWIVMAGLAKNLFSSTNGVLPLFLQNYGITMPSLMTEPQYFRGFLYVTDVWKGMGWGTIIYLAAIAGIDQELYEASVVDGCNRIRQIWHITLPCIAPTIVTLLVLNMGGIMNAGFDQIFNLYNDRVMKVADILDTYVYRLGLMNGRYEHATVIGMAKSLINCILLFSANWIAGRIGESSPL